MTGASAIHTLTQRHLRRSDAVERVEAAAGVGKKPCNALMDASANPNAKGSGKQCEVQADGLPNNRCTRHDHENICQAKYEGYKGTCKGYSCVSFGNFDARTPGWTARMTYKQYLKAQAGKALLCATQRENWEHDCNPRGYVESNHADAIQAARTAAAGCQSKVESSTPEQLGTVPHT